MCRMDWDEKNHLNIVTVLFNSVFNTFSLSFVSDTKNYFTHTHKTNFNDVFQENLLHCTMVKFSLKLKPDIKLNLDAKLVFRLKKKTVLYASLDIKEKKIVSPSPSRSNPANKFSAWAPPFAVKMTNGNVHICANYSTKLKKHFRFTSVSITNTRRRFCKAKCWNLFR